MENRFYFANKIHGQNMLRMSGINFKPDIPINHQWLVHFSTQKDLNDYQVGESIDLIWMAKLPNKYSFEIVNLHLLKEQNIVNNLVIDPTRFSFYKLLTVNLRDATMLHNLKVLLSRGFPNMNYYNNQLVKLNPKCKELENAYDAVSKEENMSNYDGDDEEEQYNNWQADVLAHEKAWKDEESRVYFDLYKFVERYGTPNMNEVPNLPELKTVFYGNVDRRVYFHTRTYNINFDDVESQDIDHTHLVMNRRFFFQFSLAFPDAFEREYNASYEDSDKQLHDSILIESGYFNRRILI